MRETNDIPSRGHRPTLPIPMHSQKMSLFGL